ncbi:MAG: sugar phosphate isomerase/epimerase [Phycisphaerae bacterium]
MLLAINAGVFSPESPVPEQLAAARRSGFAGIELVAAGDGPYTCHSDLKLCAEWARRAEEIGLAIVAVGCTQFWQANYASPETAQRQVAHERTLRLLDQAAALRAVVVVIVPAVVGRADEPQARVTYLDAFNRVYDALAELRFECEARGVVLAIENVWNRFLLSPLEAVELLDRVNSPHVGFCLDTGNILPWGYPQDWIRTLGRHVSHVHVKDYDLSKPGRAGFCPLGEGHVAWPAVLAALGEVRYDGPLVYEGKPPAEDAFARLTSIVAGAPAAGKIP